MLPEPARNLLGLAQKARSIAAGDMAADLALRRGKAALVLLAEDAAEATARGFATLAERAKVPCLVAGTKDELGLAIGKSPRAVLVVTHREFARGIAAKLTVQPSPGAPGAGPPSPPVRGRQHDRPQPPGS